MSFMSKHVQVIHQTNKHLNELFSFPLPCQVHLQMTWKAKFKFKMSFTSHSCSHVKCVAAPPLKSKL